MPPKKINKPEGIEFPEPSHHLTHYGKQFYWDMVGYLHEAKVLQKADALMVTMLSKYAGILYDVAKQMNKPEKLVQTFSSGASNISGLYTAYEKASKKVIEISARLGLSPADREKLLSYTTKAEASDAYGELVDALKD